MTSRKYSQGLPNTASETFVEIDYKIYRLVPSEYANLRDLTKNYPEGKTRPMVRHLNPVKERTKAEWASYNKESAELHNLAKGSLKSQKITSTSKALAVGANIPDEVKKLLELKKTTTDQVERRKIRQQLRKLDYKRYLQNGEEEK